MRIKSFITASSIALCAATGAASAFQVNNAHSWGVSVLPGYYKTDSTSNSNNSAYLGVRPYYQFNRYFNVGVLFGVQSTKKQGGSKKMGYTALPEIQVDMPLTHSRLVPHFEFGAGAVKAAGVSGFGVDAGFGLGYYVNRHFSISTDYRAIQQLNTFTTDHIYALGFNWTFGSAHSAVPAQQQAALTPKQQSMLNNAKTSLRYVLPHGVYRCDGSNRDLYSGCVSFEGNKMMMHLYTQFKINGANIESHYIHDINRLIQFMKQYPSVDVELKGYASSYSGSKSYNMQLSQERADAVKQYMIKHGIAAARLTAKGFGGTDENQLHAPLEYGLNKDQGLAWERKMSRRVQARAAVPAHLVDEK